jgi:hypothetical protein
MRMEEATTEMQEEIKIIKCANYFLTFGLLTDSSADSSAPTLTHSKATGGGIHANTRTTGE